MPLLHAVLLCLHVLAAALWVGGMATMHFAVRPAAVAVLEAPPRLALMSAALGRFFVAVSIAIGVLLATGLGMVFEMGGFGAVRGYVHAMLAIGLVMMGVFEHIRRRLHPRLQQAVASRDMPAAAQTLNAIRRRVELNLGLGVLVFVIVFVGRAL